MKPQIIEIFRKQYGFDAAEFSELIDNFYEHPYQRKKCIRLVAIEGKTVVGFQSFFYWPYTYNNITYNSYQSGNSLVHPDHRGKGIFQKLLVYLDQHQKKLNIDFLVGFPVIESKNSFLRNQWVNLLNLQWYVKIINPFGLLMPLNELKLKNKFNIQGSSSLDNTDFIRLSNNENFIKWRADYSYKINYLNFTYTENEKSAQFEMKVVIRKRFIKELQIGNLKTNCINDLEFLQNAFKALTIKAKKSFCLCILSIAINESASEVLVKSLLKSSFKRTNKSIFFIVKPFIGLKELLINKEWLIFRSDIDTW